VGAPYADGGRGPDVFDCWGLVRAIYREHLGVDLPSYGEIRAADLRAVARAMGAGKDAEIWAPAKAPREFDVVIMRDGRGGRRVVHVGVMVDATRVLHTTKTTGGAVIVPLAHTSIQVRLPELRRLNVSNCLS